MDAVEYLKAFYKMCDSNKLCSSCEAIGICEHDDNKAERMVEIVEKWAKGQPKKTRVDKLLEAFPNTDVLFDGFPNICPKRLERSFDKCPEEVYCLDCERKYWTEEIE